MLKGCTQFKEVAHMAYYQNPLDATTLPAWQALSQHRDAMQHFSLREAFAQDPQRFNEFSLTSSSLFLDYSKPDHH